MCYIQINKFGVTEHIEGDECKFALWEGTVAPISDTKIILRVSIVICIPLTKATLFSTYPWCPLTLDVFAMGAFL